MIYAESFKRRRQQCHLTTDNQKQLSVTTQDQPHLIYSHSVLYFVSSIILAISALTGEPTLVSAFAISLPNTKVSKGLIASIPASNVHYLVSSYVPHGSTTRVAMSSEWNNDDDSTNSNNWRSIDDESNNKQSNAPNEDWQELMARKSDGSFWTSFEPSTDADEQKRNTASSPVSEDFDEESEADVWLQTLASISAEEVQFNLKEADRADKARQMEEWGFDSQTIENTLDVAMTTKLENDDLKGMQQYREQSFFDSVDLETVESHTTVEIDEETGEPARARMVYVDEHTCIGCTNCAMIAQSTFFMHSEYGRARVFQQWGDDDETIQIAIETCPVDCIHYVPYEELKDLEIDRRNQLINFKSRLVSQGENGNTLSHKVGGTAFTAPQKISGNMRARCNNCPSRGCKNCPMFGVGGNPEYEKKEAARKERLAKQKIKKQREIDEKSVDL